MGIRWFKSAKQRRIRENPVAPKKLPTDKVKKLGKPRYPEIGKPVAKIPFVSAANCCGIHRKALRTNISAGALSKISDIIAGTVLENGQNIKGGEVKWILGRENYASSKGGEKKYGDCVEIDGAWVCPSYASGNHGKWTNFSTFMEGAREEIKNAKGGDVPRIPSVENGIWKWSHINCSCYVEIRLFDPLDSRRYLLYEVYTDPAQGSSRGVTANAGYALILNIGINPALIKDPNLEEITILNKNDSGSDNPPDVIIKNEPTLEPATEDSAEVSGQDDSSENPPEDINDSEVKSVVETNEEPAAPEQETYGERMRRMEEERIKKENEENNEIQ